MSEEDLCGDITIVTHQSLICGISEKNSDIFLVIWIVTSDIAGDGFGSIVKRHREKAESDALEHTKIKGHFSVSVHPVPDHHTDTTHNMKQPNTNLTNGQLYIA